MQTALRLHGQPALRQRQRRRRAPVSAPAEPQALAAPARRRARAPATQGVALLAAAARAAALHQASSVAHQKLVNVLENKTGHGISTGNGVVTLNLHA